MPTDGARPSQRTEQFDEARDPVDYNEFLFLAIAVPLVMLVGGAVGLIVKLRKMVEGTE